jgi:flagellar biogenesis protein FliO
MEEDGVMIWFGYLASLIATLYFVLFGALIVKHLGNWFEATLHWLGMTQ